jgi:hypothetical protein
VFGGQGGEPGKNGAPGAGGQGGIGGRSFECRTTTSPHGGEDGWACREVARASNGPHGANGKMQIAPAHGESGKSKYLDDANLIVRNEILRNTSYDDLAPFASYEQAQMLLHKTQLEYLKNNLGVTGMYIAWLEKISRGSAGAQNEDKRELRLNGEPELNPQDWKLLRQKVLSLTGQIVKGLDYYGNQWNTVPLVSYDYYKNFLEHFFPFAYRVESCRKAYKESLDKQVDASNELSTLIVLAKDLLSELNKRIRDISNEIGDKNAFISRKTAEIISYVSILQSAQEEFEDAIARLGECDWLATCKVVCEIIAVVYPVAAAVGSMMEAFDSGDGADKQIGDLKRVSDA